MIDYSVAVYNIHLYYFSDKREIFIRNMLTIVKISKLLSIPKLMAIIQRLWSE